VHRRTSPPPFFIVSAEPHDCPYLPEQTACTPLRWPRAPLTPDNFDQLLSEGDRRAGPVLYRTQCPTCTACEALRIPVHRLIPSRSQRRVVKLNERDVCIDVGPPVATQERVDMYNRHRDERGLARSDNPINLAEYHLQYVESCVDTQEVAYSVGGRLVAVSILDVGAKAASSVYHYFDPAESRRSLGVYSVIKEVELCADWGLDWYYLGLWVERCASLAYKSVYHPHQRRRAGQWREYDASGAETAVPPEEDETREPSSPH
jgi:arginyl-tRNA--protein-N-Asp/Glu arginylyltransferase